MVPEQELRRPKAMFNLNVTEVLKTGPGHKLFDIITEIMTRSNCYAKTVRVTARILKCMFDRVKDRITDIMTVRDLKLARMMQFVVLMEPTLKAIDQGKLESLRPIVEHGIAYARTRCPGSIMNILGVDKLPILARQTRLAELITSHNENHRSTPSDVLARSSLDNTWKVSGKANLQELP